MGTNIQKWGSYDSEAADAEAADLDKGGGEWLKLEPGRNVIRLLPPPAGRNTPFVVVRQHYLQMPGEADPISFNCPKAMLKKFCPVCAKADKLRSSGKARDRNRAKELYAKRRVFANVIDRNDEETGPKILGFGKSVHEQLVELRRDPDAGGDFTHPEEGYDIVIERKGSGKNDTKYKVRPGRTRPLGNLEWIMIQADLSSVAKVPTIEEIKELFNRGDDSEDEQADEEASDANEDVIDTKLADEDDEDERPAKGSKGRNVSDDFEDLIE